VFLPPPASQNGPQGDSGALWFAYGGEVSEQTGFGKAVYKIHSSAAAPDGFLAQ
jgi:hypothetical protein